MPKLTDVFIDKLKPRTKRFEVYDSLLPAFGIRCGARLKSFIVVDSSGSRRTLGHYPTMTLAQARDLETQHEIIHPDEPELRDVYGVIFWQEESREPSEPLRQIDCAQRC